MPNEDLDDAIAVNSEYRSNLFERYTNQSGKFRKLFGGSVGFAPIYFFLVLFPYFTIQMDKHRIERELKSLREVITLKEKQYAKYQAPQKGIQRLREVGLTPVSWRV